jgi:hypothetical protein
MPYRDEEIVSCARAVRPVLKDLLGEAWPVVDGALVVLITRADNSEPVADQILELLAEREPTRLWAHNFLGAELLSEATRTYKPVPGHGEPIPARRYLCPRGDYEWYRRSAAQPVPVCPHDGTALKPA